MRLTIVLLPEPLGPIRPRMSPLPSLRLTPSTAFTPPKCLQTWSSSSTERAPPSLDRSPSDAGGGIERAACGGGCAQHADVAPAPRGGIAQCGAQPAKRRGGASVDQPAGAQVH